jgi:hypothetical protein
MLASNSTSESTATEAPAKTTSEAARTPGAEPSIAAQAAFQAAGNTAVVKARSELPPAAPVGRPGAKGSAHGQGVRPAVSRN